MTYSRLYRLGSTAAAADAYLPTQNARVFIMFACSGYQLDDHLLYQHGFVLTGPVLAHTCAIREGDGSGGAAHQTVAVCATMPTAPTEKVACCSGGGSGNSSK